MIEFLKKWFNLNNLEMERLNERCIELPKLIAQAVKGKKRVNHLRKEFYDKRARMMELA